MKCYRFLFIGLLCVASLGYAKLTLNYDLTGIDHDKAQKNAENRLAINTKDDGVLTSAKIQNLYREGSNNIIQALEPYGFFRAHISNKSLTRSGNTWTAHYNITPSTRIQYTQVRLSVKNEGSSNPKIQQAISLFQLKVGDPFNVQKYKEARNNILLAAQKQGYIKARMSTDKVTINVPRYTCTVTLKLNTGPRFYFGPTFFSKSPLSNRFLARYLNYKPGNHFSSKQLMQLQNNLSSGGYFKGVSVAPELERIKNKRVPVKVQLTPNKRKRYQIGLGYGSVSGARVSGGIDWRWVNAWGDSFNTNFNLSQVDSNLQAQYNIPGRNPAKDKYYINAGVFTLIPRRGKAFVRKVGVGYMTKFWKIESNLSLSYVGERYRIRKNQRFRNAHVLLPNWTLSYLSTKDAINVKNGTRLSLTFQGGSENAFSSVSFFQTILYYKSVHTLWKNNRFLLMANGGSTTMKDPNNLPLSFRFYTGGIGSIRGFASQSIGPGRYLAVASAEYQRRVYGSFYGAIFYDVGNAFDNYSEFRKTLRRGAGVGVVWLSPVGSVSIYAAKALSSKGQPIRVLFSLGAEL